MTVTLTETFCLDPQLARDSIFVDETDLCMVLLARDARYPWVILVPKRPYLEELHDLSAPDQIRLIEEITYISETMQSRWQADKSNIATLGNKVPQLHIHIVMRFIGDAAWPGPVWGMGEPENYTEDHLRETLQAVRACFP